MATHHVSLRRFCPNQNRRLTASPGECDLKRNPTQAQRALSNRRSRFYPQERFTAEPSNTIELGRCKIPTKVILHTKEETAMQGGYSHPYQGAERSLPCELSREVC
jgi:hypothetical protein